MKPGRRVFRSKSMVYDRNVQIGGKPSEENNGIILRRSTRNSVPVKHFNYGAVKCFVCKKIFREDVSIEYYSGNIVCSFECFNKAN